MDIRARILEAFKIECAEHLAYIRSRLAKVEEAGDHALEQADLDEMYRRAHSLKGAARAADLPPVQTMAHQMETLFSEVKAHARRIDDEAISIIDKVVNAIEDWVAALDGNGPKPDPAEATALIAAYLDGRPGGPKDAAKVTKGSDGKKPADKPRSPGNGADPAPAQPVVMQAAPTAAPSTDRSGGDFVRVGANRLDRLLRSAGQILTECIAQDEVSKQLSGVQDGLAGVERAMRLFMRDHTRNGHFALDADTLDTFIDSMDHKIQVLVRTIRATRIRQSGNAWAMRQLAVGLQSDISSARMVPVDAILAGFPKMVRDIAAEEGKEVELRVTGHAVEADRAVVQMLKDPLMHMIRNAIYHGIEAPEDRKAAGKRPAGRLRLHFSLVRNRLSVELEDDGRGLQFQRIRDKLVSMGLMEAGEVASLSTEELTDHLMRAGFSTAATVSELAGRGMGMSVVGEAVAKLDGTIEAESKEGKGTIFRISVPLTIATRNVLLCRAAGAIYALPTDGIARLLRIVESDVRTIEGRSMVVVGDDHLPLVTLAALLDFADDSVGTVSGAISAVVLQDGSARVVVAVDELQTLRSSIIQDIGMDLPNDHRVAGGILLEDGSIACVINTNDLVRRAGARGTQRVRTSTQVSAERRRTLLVVDDSFTTRTLEKSVLEAHDYEVHLAVDGVEALERLRENTIDLIVTDVEMPRLDGFGLLRQLKADQALAGIPVIMVTSLEKREHREQGMKLGADAYIVKREFDQQELLETIGQLI